MLLIRDIMHCKPGKVRPMVDRFKALAELTRKRGLGSMRVMTDVVGERYWTVVAEFEVKSLSDFEAMMAPETMKDFGAVLEGYHDLVDAGRREIYTIEA